MTFTTAPSHVRRLAALIAAVVMVGVGSLVFPVGVGQADEPETKDELLSPLMNEACYYSFIAQLILTSEEGTGELLPLLTPVNDTCSLFGISAERRVCGADNAWLTWANANSPYPMGTAPVGIAVDTIAGAERVTAGEATAAPIASRQFGCVDRRPQEDYEEFIGDGVVPLVRPRPPATPAPAPQTEVLGETVSRPAVVAAPAPHQAAAAVAAPSEPKVTTIRPSVDDLISHAAPVPAGSMNVFEMLAAAAAAIAAMWFLNRRLFSAVPVPVED